MARGKKTRKCQWCGIDDTLMEDMEFEVKGEKAPKKLFFHKDCYGDYREKQDFLDKERAEKDALVEVINDIYRPKGGIPRQAYPFLEAIRNGEPVFGDKQQIGKRYKEGYSYDLIRETYEHCTETIEYWNSVKGFDGFMQAFKYGLSIIIDKIYMVEQRVLERQKQERMIEKHVADNPFVDEHFEVEYETNFKKKDTKKNDITDFLD